MELRNRAAVLALSVLAVGAGLAVLVVSNTASRTSSCQDEQLFEVLKELSRRFFFVCQDVAAIAKSVHAKIKASGTQISDEKLKEQLARQCKVFEKLQQIQNEVAEQFGLTPVAIAEMQEQAAEDSEMESYSVGFRAMLDDALAGKSPILPNVKIPKALTEEKALEIHRQVQEVEAKKVLDTVSGSKCSLKELGEVLAVAHKSAWDQVLEAESELLHSGGPEVYHSAVAIYSRHEKFAEEKKKLEDTHQQRMIGLFQPNGHGQVVAQKREKC